MMGTASCHDYLVNLSEALDSPPDLIVYKTELEGHLIDVRLVLECVVFLSS